MAIEEDGVGIHIFSEGVNEKSVIVINRAQRFINEQINIGGASCMD